MDRRFVYLGIAALVAGIYAILAAQSLSTMVTVDKWVYEKSTIIGANETYAVKIAFNPNVTIIVNIMTYEHCIDFKFMDESNYERFLLGESYNVIENVEHTANYMLTYWNTEVNKTYVVFLSNIAQCFDKIVQLKIGVSRMPARTPTEEKALLTKVGFGTIAGGFWLLMYGILKERKI